MQLPRHSQFDSVRPEPALTGMAAAAELVLRLQTTLEIRDLLHHFSTGLQSVVPHSGMRYRHRSNDLTVGRWEGAPYRCRQALVLVGEALGELVLTRSEPFTPEEYRRLDSLASLLLHPLRNGLRYRRAVESAQRDPLTALGNRRALDMKLRQQLGSATHIGSLSVLMLDLDRFKAINDHHGHAAGDRLLLHFSRILSETVRGSGRAFRYGGDEFVIIMPEADARGAFCTAERIRREAMRPRRCGGQMLEVTVSAGITQMTDGDDETDLLKRADQALHAAKRLGRNRICWKPLPAGPFTSGG